MMSPHLIDIVAAEQRKDLLRELEQRRLINQLPNRSHYWSRHVATWLGSQMVKWGLKLQGINGGAFIQASAEPGPVGKGLPN